jgi:eukaryotic translation initiation factor 2C
MVNIRNEHRTLVTKSEMLAVFWKFCATQKQAISSEFEAVFDGCHQLFTVKPLKMDFDSEAKAKVSINVTIPGEGRPSSWTLEFKKIGDQKLKIKREIGNDNELSIQVIDTVLSAAKTCPFTDDKFIPGGHGFYLPPRELGYGRPGDMDLGLGREIWTGYVPTAHLGRGWQPLLNVNTSHTAFFKAINVVQFLCEVMESSGGGRMGQRNKWNPQLLHYNSAMDDREVAIFQKEIKGLYVVAPHNRPRGSDRMPQRHKVRGMAKNPQQLSFNVKDANGRERKITVADHFRFRGINLRLPFMPCLQCGSTKFPTYFPMELCEIAPNQKSNKKLSEQQTSFMIRKACLDGVNRQRLTEEMVQQARLSKDRFANAFGLTVEPRMVELTGRRLAPPKINLGQNQWVNPNAGTWNYQPNTKFYRPARIGCWAVLNALGPSVRPHDIQRFCGQLARTCLGLGIQMQEYPARSGMAHDVPSLPRTFEWLVNQLEQQCGGRGDDNKLILVLLQNKGGNSYGNLKTLAEMECGIVTQIVLAKNVMKCQVATMANLALKINAKLGGINHSISAPVEQSLVQLFQNEQTMVLGIDVTHPAPTECRYPSVAAIIGNVDPIPGQFHASLAIGRVASKNGFLDLTKAINERFHDYYQHLNTKPERVIIYRGGVSHNQMQQTMIEEVKCLRRVCNQLQEHYTPKVTYIVAQKRHHTRFFCRDPREQAGRAKNVPPGTVVDATVAHPSNFDFYLCSHIGIQGTSRPTHYSVLHDENGFTSDQVQLVSYALCHLYFRCNRAVSIPAPLYYAELAVQRARLHLGRLCGIADTESLSSYDTRSDDFKDALNPQSTEEMEKAVTVRCKNKMYFA